MYLPECYKNTEREGREDVRPVRARAKLFVRRLRASRQKRQCAGWKAAAHLQALHDVLAGGGREVGVPSGGKLELRENDLRRRHVGQHGSRTRGHPRVHAAFPVEPDATW